MDYARYTGSNQFEKTVGEALVINSYGAAHDFFGTNHSYVSLVIGRWNDDVEWQAPLLELEPNFMTDIRIGMLKLVNSNLPSVTCVHFELGSAG